MIKILQNRISKEELDSFLGKPFSNMIKFVVDIKKEAVALGGELHSDAEALLLKQGSSQSDLWGGNLYPSNPKEKWLEFSSLINIRPSANNNSMEVKDGKIREKIKMSLEKILP